MASSSCCSDTPSIYELLLKRKVQDGDASLASPQDVTQTAPALAVKTPTMLADLHVLRELTQQLHRAEAGAPHDESDTKSTPAQRDGQKNAETRDGEALATLYCRRAAALLAFVDYDATAVMPLEVLEAFSDDALDEANQPPASLGAVRQALQDAQAAVTLTAISTTNAEANFLAAQCARSLGELAHAREFVVLAAAAANGNAEVARLAAQLELEAANADSDAASAASHAVLKLKSSSAVLKTLVIAESEQMTPQTPQQQEGEADETNNELPEHTEAVQPPPTPFATLLTPGIAFWAQVAAQFHVLESAATSCWLVTLENLLHHNVHHRCASPSDVKQMDETLRTTLALLLLLLQSGPTHTTLGGLDMTDEAATRTLEKLTQATSSSPQTLVQNRTARRWIVDALAPAVRLALVSSSSPQDTEASLNASSKSSGVVTWLLYDVLTMLTRLLQASGSWRRCTNMAHVRAYAELSCNLSKQLRTEADTAGNWSRLEMQSSNALGAALLQRHGALDQTEALSLHRESLQAALQAGDAEYELHCRLFVARTLRDMAEIEAAYAELTQLLARSRTRSDAHMQAVAQYELGVCCVARGELEKAERHLKEAQTLCNQTADCASSWRPRSVQQAIAFYARLKPTARRGAIRVNLGALVQAAGGDDTSDESDESDESEEDYAEEQEPLALRPKTRRAAFCIKHGSPEHRSLLSALLGSTRSAMELLGSHSKPKPKRTLDWRHSVFATASPAEMNAETSRDARQGEGTAVAPEEASI